MIFIGSRWWQGTYTSMRTYVCTPVYQMWSADVICWCDAVSHVYILFFSDILYDFCHPHFIVDSFFFYYFFFNINIYINIFNIYIFLYIFLLNLCGRGREGGEEQRSANELSLGVWQPLIKFLFQQPSTMRLQLCLWKKTKRSPWKSIIDRKYKIFDDDTWYSKNK